MGTSSSPSGSLSSTSSGIMTRSFWKRASGVSASVASPGTFESETYHTSASASHAQWIVYFLLIAALLGLRGSSAICGVESVIQRTRSVVELSGPAIPKQDTCHLNRHSGTGQVGIGHRPQIGWYRLPRQHQFCVALTVKRSAFI